MKMRVYFFMFIVSGVWGGPAITRLSRIFRHVSVSKQTPNAILNAL